MITSSATCNEHAFADSSSNSATSAPTSTSTSVTDNAIKPSAEAKKLLASIADLVKDFFPKAKIVTTENSLHFEYKVHERMHPYNRRIVLSPDLDGILGDVELKSGGPSDRIIGVIERPEAVHSVLTMAPYSASDKTWLSTRMLFQPVTPLEFMESFKKLVGSYDHPDNVAQTSSLPTSTNNKLSSEPAKGSITSQPDIDATPAIAPGSSQESKSDATATLGVQTSQIISKETTPAPAFESSTKLSATANTPMDKYSYPEGHFKIMLPGSPQVKYSDQSGMRMVDYVYAVPEGTFNISYVILPEAPPNLKTSQLLDNMSQSVVNSMKGMHTKQYASSLQGFPGCQLEVPELANKPGQSARFRIYLVRNFVYIIGLNGKKEWLNTANAKDFLDSFQVNLNQSAQRTSQSAKPFASPDVRVLKSQSEKDYERSRADREFRRR